MFSRAPDGGDMINDFRALMTRERVQNVQGYFISHPVPAEQILPLLERDWLQTLDGTTR
jgi:hypothetical protein